MIKNSFQTIFKSPKILVGFAIPLICIYLAFLPMILYQNGRLDSSLAVAYALSMLIIMVIGLVIQFLFFPAFLNFIYEISSGRNEKGRIKRGLQRNWWKIFVTTIIACMLFCMIYAICFVILMCTMVINVNDYQTVIIIYGALSVFFVFWLALFYIAQVSVVAEEKYDDGLKNIFKIGFKNYFKIVLASFIYALFSVVIGVIRSIFIYQENSSLEMFGVSFSDFSNNPTVLVIAFTLMLAINIITMSFMYVYTNKIYIAKRQELMEKQQESANNKQEPIIAE